MSTDTGSVLGIVSVIISVGGAIYAAINHKRLRCKCCGKDIDIQVDVDSTEAQRRSGHFEKTDGVHQKPNLEETTNSIITMKPSHPARILPM